MIDTNIELPKSYSEIKTDSEKISFSMPSDLQTGSLLRTLVATKKDGHFLELGTGTGLSLAWMAEGMSENSTLITIDNSLEYQSVAKRHIQNSNVSFVCEDAENWILNYKDSKFDLIFADAWPGKYSVLEETLNLLKSGGIYLIDDMLPQSNWPQNHDKNVEMLIQKLENRKDIQLTKMCWSTGLILITKK
ncbi:methyltransferase domain-containing protein [Flavobacterium zhairuonense]|uniref:O-methyltransferase n=1 Tax=Flavobacterium zhairuonense TaxID=2493631 RepID=UPI001043924C|nr:methyltransferase domain-containing protein [Flavobacterium zhairuonense]KAF2507722.1 methyltransferase domain-containing protein [Flavobacterium zhairuonense]